jgi:hypothetical protein
MAASLNRAILNPSAPAPMPGFQPVLPYGLGGSLAAGAPRAPAQFEAPAQMDTSHSTKITETLIATMPDEAVDNYEFAPLFVRLCKEDRPEVWAHWDLNTKLRSVAADRRRKVRGKEADKFPCTIDEFFREFRFAGYQLGAIQNPAYAQRRFKTDRRIFTVQVKGELHNFPNIWGEAARVGYDVGFQVCYVNIGGREANNPTDWRGQPYDDGHGPVEVPDMRVLQVVPVVCKGMNVPLETLPIHNQKYATHSMETVVLKFKGDDKEVAIDMNQTACFIYVGRCKRLMGKASSTDTDNASGSAAAYKNLSIMRSQIDIDMMPEGKNLKWVV